MGNYLTHQINSAHIIWFAKSNQWVQLDEPQWFIFLLYRDGVLRREAIERFARRWGKGNADSTILVNNLYDSLEIMDGDGFAAPDYTVDTELASAYTLERSRTYHYQQGSKSFSICYGSPHLEQYIHLPFAHLITEVAATQLHLELFPFRGRYAMRINGERCLTTNESPQLKRLLFVELAGHLFNIPASGWMAHLHASAVEKDGRLVLLASPSGSGKSTLAARLMQRGYRLFSDDFIPVCLERQLLYPFPPALCIKKGALEEVQQQGIRPQLVHHHTGYLQPDNPIIQPMKATEMIFVNYRAGATTSLEPVPPEEALQILLQESWVSNRYEGASKFIHWFKGLTFRRLIHNGSGEELELLG